MPTGSITVRPVASRRDLKAFLRLPWALYAGNPYWVPPLLVAQKALLSRQKNPFFEHSDAELFLALRRGEVVGRIAAIENRRHNEHWKETTGFFGFFECVKEFDVARALYDAARQWVADRRLTMLRGPTSFSTNDEVGFLLEAFDRPPVILMPYTHRYYLEFAERYGFAKAKDLYSFYIDDTIMDVSRYERVVKEVMRRVGFTVRPMNRKRYWDELALVRSVYNDAWSDNWGFVPMTDAELEHLARELKPLAQEQLILFGERDGEPIAFSLSVPDINRILIKMNGRLFPFGLFRLLFGLKKIDSLRTLTLGVRKAYQRRGVEAAFLIEILRRTTGVGYHVGEMGWTLEDNHLINRAMERVGGRLHRKFRLVEMPL